MEAAKFLNTSSKIERNIPSRDGKDSSDSNTLGSEATGIYSRGYPRSSRHPNIYDNEESLTEYVSLPSPHSVTLNNSVGDVSLTRLSCFAHPTCATTRNSSTLVDPKTPSVGDHRTLDRMVSALKSRDAPFHSSLPTTFTKKSVLIPELEKLSQRIQKCNFISSTPGYPNFPHVETSPSSEITQTENKLKSKPKSLADYNDGSSDDENCPPESAEYDVCKHFARSLCLSKDIESEHQSDQKQARCNVQKRYIKQNLSHTESRTVEKDVSEDDLTYQYLIDERERLQNKLNYIKLTSEAYRMRLAALDSNIKLVRSLVFSSQNSVCECPTGSEEARSIANRPVSCKECSFHHFSLRKSAHSEF